MGLILYRCSDDLPDKIPGILAGMSSGVTCEGGREIGSESDSSFSYTVTRAKARISIFGGIEDGVMIFSIVDGSRSFLRGFFGVRARMELLEDVTGALLEAGVKEITSEELEEIDAQRRREAEQASSGQPATRPEAKLGAATNLNLNRRGAPGSGCQASSLAGKEEP